MISSASRGCWEADKVSAVTDPPWPVQLGEVPLACPALLLWEACAPT